MIARVALIMLLVAGPALGQDAGAEEEGAEAVVGSKKSDKYHRLDCRWAKKIAAANLVTFKSPAEAKAAGYTPCKTCEPPE